MSFIKTLYLLIPSAKILYSLNDLNLVKNLNSKNTNSQDPIPKQLIIYPYTNRNSFSPSNLSFSLYPITTKHSGPSASSPSFISPLPPFIIPLLFPLKTLTYDKHRNPLFLLPPLKPHPSFINLLKFYLFLFILFLFILLLSQA